MLLLGGEPEPACVLDRGSGLTLTVAAVSQLSTSVIVLLQCFLEVENT